MEREFAALDSYQLLPRLIHDVHVIDSSCELVGRRLGCPIIPFVEREQFLPDSDLCLVAAAGVLGHPERYLAATTVPLLQTEKMGELMPKVRKLAGLGIPALALDMTVLAGTAPYGSYGWRPRTREDLAELRAAAGCPLWLFGVASVADAEVAMEAGLEAIVVHCGGGVHLGAPAAIEILPEVFDAVAGMIAIYAGGPVRHGIDVFRYLAVGADAVVVDSDRSLDNLEAELHYAMRLTGCGTLAEIGYEAVFAPLFGESL